MFDNSEVSDVQVIKPGLKKSGIRFVAMKKDSKDRSVTFFFEDATKAILNHREFAPNRTISGKTLSDEEYTKNIKLSVSRIAHISRAYLSEQEFLAIKVTNPNSLVEADVQNNWDTYIRMTAMALQVQPTGIPNKAVGVLADLKVVYKETKSKWYSSLPAVPPFISTPNHPKEFSINPQYDKFEIPTIKPDTENKPKATEGFSGASTTGFTDQPLAKPAEHESGF